MSPESPYPPLPSQPPPMPAQQSPGRAADLTGAIVLLALYGLALGVLSFFSLFLFMAGDSCTESTCNEGEMTAGIGVAALGPWFPFVLAAVAVIVQGVRGRLTWWVPLVAAVVSLGIFLLGVALVMAGSGH